MNWKYFGSIVYPNLKIDSTPDPMRQMFDKTVFTNHIIINVSKLNNIYAIYNENDSILHRILTVSLYNNINHSFFNDKVLYGYIKINDNHSDLIDNDTLIRLLFGYALYKGVNISKTINSPTETNIESLIYSHLKQNNEKLGLHLNKLEPALTPLQKIIVDLI